MRKKIFDKYQKGDFNICKILIDPRDGQLFFIFKKLKEKEFCYMRNKSLDLRKGDIVREGKLPKGFERFFFSVREKPEKEIKKTLEKIEKRLR